LFTSGVRIAQTDFADLDHIRFPLRNGAAKGCAHSLSTEDVINMCFVSPPPAFGFWAAKGSLSVENVILGLK
jgi:hypothetical protein